LEHVLTLADSPIVTTQIKPDDNRLSRRIRSPLQMPEGRLVQTQLTFNISQELKIRRVVGIDLDSSFS
jgi:hypothetical protein